MLIRWCYCRGRTLKLQPQLDHNGPLMVPAGTDKFRDIGRPRGAVDGNVVAGTQVRACFRHKHKQRCSNRPGGGPWVAGDV